MGILNDMIELSDKLMDAASADDKPAVLIAQYDLLRDEDVYRWSCEDRSIGFRRENSGPASKQEIDELIRVWQSAEFAPGSTKETMEKAALAGPETRVLRVNAPKD